MRKPYKGRTREALSREEIAGIPNRWYGSVWWAIAAWNSAFVFNIWARTQQFGFALPLAPDFKDAATPYAVSAIGGIGGAILLSAVSAGLWLYAARWPGSGWLGRVPSVAKELGSPQEGMLPVLLQVFVLLITLVFPVAMQLHFVDKYLSGTSTRLDGSIYADSWRGHLLFWPAQACSDFVYDGKRSAAYCEFYEPWAVVFSALISLTIVAFSVNAVFRR